jgi:hypothetical protein
VSVTAGMLVVGGRGFEVFSDLEMQMILVLGGRGLDCLQVAVRNVCYVLDNRL